MDDANVSEIEAKRPIGNQSSAHLFTHNVPGSRTPDLANVHHTRDFDGTLDLIDVAANGLKRAL